MFWWSNHVFMLFRVHMERLKEINMINKYLQYAVALYLFVIGLGLSAGSAACIVEAPWPWHYRMLACAPLFLMSFVFYFCGNAVWQNKEAT